MDITSWEQAYVDQFTPWDRGAASPPLVEWLDRHSLHGRALIPGCGKGHDAAYVASRGLKVTGLDIAPTAIALAQENYPQLAQDFICADFFSHAESYDVVIEHTCLSALPPELRIAYRDAMARVTKAGGLLIGVWFVNPELDPGETGPPFGITAEELRELFDADFEIMVSYTPDNSFPGREERELLRVMRRRG